MGVMQDTEPIIVMSQSDEQHNGSCVTNLKPLAPTFCQSTAFMASSRCGSIYVIECIAALVLLGLCVGALIGVQRSHQERDHRMVLSAHSDRVFNILQMWRQGTPVPIPLGWNAHEQERDGMLYLTLHDEHGTIYYSFRPIRQ